jgi:hypothetical protein
MPTCPHLVRRASRARQLFPGAAGGIRTDLAHYTLRKPNVLAVSPFPKDPKEPKITLIGTFWVQCLGVKFELQHIWICPVFSSGAAPNISSRPGQVVSSSLRTYKIETLPPVRTLFSRSIAPARARGRCPNGFWFHRKRSLKKPQATSATLALAAQSRQRRLGGVSERR